MIRVKINHKSEALRYTRTGSLTLTIYILTEERPSKRAKQRHKNPMEIYQTLTEP